MTREWKPGDVAMVTIGRRCGDGSDETTYTAFFAGRYGWYGVTGDEGCGGLTENEREFVITRRPLVVIDPDDREQVAALLNAWERAEFSGTLPEQPMTRMELRLRTALREFANPTPPRPDEPTDPTARVTDRRENIWRQLADGDWVCTSGPDVGEYLNWDQLAGDRGPVTIEVTP